MAKSYSLGKLGEEAAKALLVIKGYSIIETNWHLHHLEIDIIARKDNRIVFVEIKTRSNDFTDPVEAVDRAKMRRMVVAADAYINARKVPFPIQFDIIAIKGSDPASFDIEHLEDAFFPTDV